MRVCSEAHCCQLGLPAVRNSAAVALPASAVAQSAFAVGLSAEVQLPALAEAVVASLPAEPKVLLSPQIISSSFPLKC